MSPTTKQVELAAKLFNDIAARSAKHGAPISRKDYRADMQWLGLNPDVRADVSEYIGLHITAKRDAAMTLKGKVT